VSRAQTDHLEPSRPRNARQGSRGESGFCCSDRPGRPIGIDGRGNPQVCAKRSVPAAEGSVTLPGKNASRGVGSTVAERLKTKYAILLMAWMAPLPGEARSVITDPVAPGVTQCGFYVDSAAKVVLPVVPSSGGSICIMDIDGIDMGMHTIVVTAISVDDPFWGSQESSPSLPLVLGTRETTATTGLMRAARAAARFARANARWALIAAVFVALALGGVVWLRRR
jgi:hypothetical protein